MTKRPQQRLTPRSAERALDHSGSSGNSRVDAVLAASAAPATGFELNREADTVAMFRASRLSNAPAAVRLTMIQSTRKRLAAAKVTVAATAAVLLVGGGVAFAASTGNLPEVLGGDPGSDNGSSPSSQAPGQEGKGKPAKPAPTGGPAGTPDPSLKGTCKAFQAAATSNPGKAAQKPAFSALAAAAGGRENIAAYCVTLIGAPGSLPTSGPTDGPTNGLTDGPTNGPTDGPPDSPGNQPTHPAHPVHPTHPAHPTKAPNAPKADKTPNPNKPTAKPTHPEHPENSNKPTKAPKTPKS